MDISRALGIAAVVLGAVLLGFAYNASQAPMEQISNTLTGRYTDNTMWYMIAGIAAVVGGGLLAVVGRRA
jgi:LPXTG-motif cell wall-anchored protein